MSRVGKKPIPITKGVDIKIEGNNVTAKGPKGTLSLTAQSDMSLEIKEGMLIVSRPSDSKDHKAFHGLTRTLIANMVQGVSEGFQKNLEISGVGFRVQAAEGKLIFNLGFSAPVEFVAPPGILLSVQGNNKLTVAGADKELVGRTSAQIRALRPPDHYKGKGIRYAGERVRIKAGKAGKIGAKK